MGVLGCTSHAWGSVHRGSGQPCAWGSHHVLLCPLSSGRVLSRTLSHLGTGRLHFLGRVLANLSSCVRLDRFQALESAAMLDAKARELMRQNSFLASKCPVTEGSLGHCADSCHLPISP